MEVFSLVPLRIFDYVGRSMERLGYLKYLLQRVSATPTSNFENLGKDLVSTVRKKVQVPLTIERLDYINSRVRGNALKAVRADIEIWLDGSGDPPIISVEIQDLYLSDPSIPSRVGRLVEDNWRRYPALGTNLGFIRKGTNSINTRGISLLRFTSQAEIEAFKKYDSENNPLLINKQQGLLLLYSLIENDGEISIPTWSQIALKEFSEKEAGNLLPNVYKSAINRHRKRLLPIDIRERLDVLESTAKNIEKVALSSKSYGGTSPREVAIRPRIEPFVDFGLIIKPNPNSYEYYFSEIGKRWVEVFSGDEDSQVIGNFLEYEFFHTAAKAWRLPVHELTSPDEIVPYLKLAAKSISSSSGYAPIIELGLFGGIWAITKDNCIFEIAAARGGSGCLPKR